MNWRKENLYFRQLVVHDRCFYYTPHPGAPADEVDSWLTQNIRGTSFEIKNQPYTGSIAPRKIEFANGKFIK
jgi:hypothetical protein